MNRSYYELNKTNIVILCYTVLTTPELNFIEQIFKALRQWFEIYVYKQSNLKRRLDEAKFYENIVMSIFN